MSSTTTTATKKKQKKNCNTKYTLSELKTLGKQLISWRAHVNNLPILLTFVTADSPPRYALESILSLQSFFTPLLPQLPSSSTPPNSSNSADPEFIYRTWVRSKFDDLVSSLIQLSISPKSHDALRESVLDALMEFVKVGNAGKFNSSIYHKFLNATIHSVLGVDDNVLELLATKYFSYIDVRYFTYISLEKLARTLEVKDENGRRDPEVETQLKPSIELSILKIHYLLSHIPPLEASDKSSDHKMWNELGIFTKSSKRQAKSHKLSKTDDKVLSSRNVAKKIKSKFTKAWMTFLRLPLPLHVYKEVLATLHQAVIPYLSNPIMLCDFLTKSYDIGGLVSVMALSGLYILMTQHGLEYPNFYNKLYALLEPSIFMAKHRSNFFQLLDSCLKSSLLPAYLAAAFCKKLSRLALSIPPSGVLVIFALVHNLLHRHHSIYCLVHREREAGTTRDTSTEENGNLESVGDGSASRGTPDKPGTDHFKFDESDPKDTHALSSSLWEIDTLRHHYCPAVSSFVKSLENDFAVKGRAAEIAVKDFSSGSYGTIFNYEMRRWYKQVPLAFYKATPTSLFSESDFPGWTFNIKEETNATEHDLDIPSKRQRVE